MNRRLLALFAIASVGIVVVANAKNSGQTYSLERAGRVQIGTEFSVLRNKVLWTAGYGADVDDAADCEIYTGRLLPKAVSMMVIDGVVTRFNLYDEGGRGPFDIRLGDSEAVAMKKLPPGVQVSQHHYGGENDHYLSWRLPRSDLAVRVETWGGKVTSVYWGRWSSVQFVEGCL